MSVDNNIAQMGQVQPKTGLARMQDALENLHRSNGLMDENGMPVTLKKTGNLSSDTYQNANNKSEKKNFFSSLTGERKTRMTEALVGLGVVFASVFLTPVLAVPVFFAGSLVIADGLTRFNKLKE